MNEAGGGNWTRGPVFRCRIPVVAKLVHPNNIRGRGHGAGRGATASASPARGEITPELYLLMRKRRRFFANKGVVTLPLPGVDYRREN